jgi:acyl-CoA synthetase (NDP forming)
VPAFAFPEDAARALALAADHGAWCADPERPEVRVAPAPRPEEAAAVIATALAEGGGWLDAAAIAALARAYGIPLAEARVTRSPTGAGRAAVELGLPVALKAIAPGLLHKTDAGAVRLGLTTRAAVRRAAAQVSAAVAAAGHAVDGFLVQRMAAPGTELLVGVTQDPLLGSVLACAAGGTAVELVRDAAVRLMPLHAGDAEALLRSLATFPLLDGYRGAPRADLAAVVDVIERVGALADAHREIVELDCNPVLAGPAGATVVDMRVRVAPARPLPPAPSLQAER